MAVISSSYISDSMRHLIVFEAIKFIYIFLTYMMTNASQKRSLSGGYRLCFEMFHTNVKTKYSEIETIFHPCDVLNAMQKLDNEYSMEKVDLHRQNTS